MGDSFKVHSKEVIDIILLAVHLQDLENILFVYQESLSEVLSNSRLNLVVNQNLLEESVCVFPVTLGLEVNRLLLEQCDLQLGWYLGERDSD